jgi:hypothetical protein
MIGWCARDFGRIKIVHQGRLGDALPHVPGAERHMVLLDVLGDISREETYSRKGNQLDAEAELATHHDRDNPVFAQAITELERLAEEAAALDNGSETDELVRTITQRIVAMVEEKMRPAEPTASANKTWPFNDDSCFDGEDNPLPAEKIKPLIATPTTVAPIIAPTATATVTAIGNGQEQQSQTLPKSETFPNPVKTGDYLAHLQHWLDRGQNLPDILEQWNAERGQREAQCSPREVNRATALLSKTIRARFPRPDRDVDPTTCFLLGLYYWSATDNTLGWNRQRPIYAGFMEPDQIAVLDDVLRARSEYPGKTLDEIEIEEQREQVEPPTGNGYDVDVARTEATDYGQYVEPDSVEPPAFDGYGNWEPDEPAAIGYGYPVGQCSASAVAFSLGVLSLAVMNAGGESAGA